MAKKTATVDRNICVACGACMKVCPIGSISVYRGCFAVVDASRCVGCLRCMKECPAGCIGAQERSEVK